MASNPSYEELQQRVTFLERKLTELQTTKESTEKRASRLREIEAMALLGHWELDLATNTLYWSDEIYKIFDLSPNEFEATYDAFLNRIHPDDREYVDKAYRDSVTTKSGYDITHRLLLRDGRTKYVHEKCKTEYDADGKPIRSLGTVQDITERINASNQFAGMVGRDPSMQELFETINDVAGHNVPVLIQGESGTGKELVAQAIHNQSPRANRPFVAINCSALPEGLLESEMFGHVKGAFTGAIRDKAGRFQLADGGTLFLDEIADLPKLVQGKLLRALQESRFERVGDEKTISVDVRIISAANRDLRREVYRGNFREDLYYRICVVPIAVPPLRDRKTDIPLLIEHLLERIAQEGQFSEGLSKMAISRLMEYSWPGNVRELQSALRYALIKSKGSKIEPYHLPLELNKTATGQDQQTPPHPSDFPPMIQTSESFEVKRNKPVKFDEQYLRKVLKEVGGNKTEAAKMLGIGRATLYRHLKNHTESN